MKGGKRSGLKAKPKSKAGKRRGVRRQRHNVPDVASLSETKGLSVLATNQMYQQYATQLVSFPRAVNVAKSYQLFRIKSIKYVVQPLSDTFIATGASASGSTVPYLYYMIDRTKNLLTANTAQALKRAGAIPRRLDDKTISFSYRPSVLQAGLDVAGSPAVNNSVFTQYKISPWLNTRDLANTSQWYPDTTDHQGIKFIVENSGGLNIAYKLDMVIEFEFKKPSYEITASETMPAPIDLETVPERPESNVPE